MLLGEKSTSNDTVSTSFHETNFRPPLSIDPKGSHSKLSTMGTGLFLLIFSIMVVVFDSSNFLAIGLAFFILLAGIGLVMMGAIGGFEKKPELAPTHTEIVREVVKVRCKYCNALNYETSQRCGNCGAQL